MSAYFSFGKEETEEFSREWLITCLGSHDHGVAELEVKPWIICLWGLSPGHAVTCSKAAELPVRASPSAEHSRGRHCSKPFTSISSFNPHYTLWSRDFIAMLPHGHQTGSVYPFPPVIRPIRGSSKKKKRKKNLPNIYIPFVTSPLFFFFFLKRGIDYLRPRMLIRFGGFSRRK